MNKMTTDVRENENIATDRDNFIPTYVKLPEKAATTIRFFDRGEKYTVYGSDAHFVSQEVLGITTAVKKLLSLDKKTVVEYFNVNRSRFERFVRDLLLVKQYCVELWVENKGGWKPEFKGSPGNLSQFEELLFSNTEIAVNNGVIGIRVSSSGKTKLMGIAHINTNERILNLIEFVDNESFTNFETVLVQLSPKEAVTVHLTASQGGDDNKVDQILRRNNILVNERKSSEFEREDIELDLKQLLKSNAVICATYGDKKLARSALAGVIKHLDLMSNESYLGQFTLLPFDFGLYVKMDSAACEALHLTQNQLEMRNPRNLTITSVLDKCRTAQGHRLLAQFLRQPLVDKQKLEERLDLVEVFVTDSLKRDALYEEHLRRVPDYQLLARKFSKQKATLLDCYKSYRCLTKLPKLIEDLDSVEGPQKKVVDSYFVNPLKGLVDDCSNFVHMIDTTLDLTLADQGEFMIRPDFDDKLQALRNDMDRIKAAMETEANNTRKSLQIEDKVLKLETVGHLGFHFRMTLKDEKVMRNQNFNVLDSKAGSVRFRTSKMDSLNEKYSKLTNQYEKEQKGFKEELMTVASGYHESFELLGNILALLDVILSFAHVSANAPTPFVRPKLHPKGTGIIHFEQLRHPCVEAQCGVNFIPNDIHLEKRKESFVIITGPNMGGKSTFLRSVGVGVLMAHIGCFVPASVAEISIVDAILARVGASDCIQKGISTFMAEMLQMSFILKTATPDSLVLVDELGRGTSTYDGYGLCWAISDKLAKSIDCYTIMATHFHELTSLADEVEHVVNFHVTAFTDEAGLSMLYKVERGACDRSFGIHVAQVTDFPMAVIETAKSMSKVLEDYSQELDTDDSEEALEKRKNDKIAGLVEIDNFLRELTRLAHKYEAENDKSALQMDAEILLQGLKDLDNPFISHVLQVTNC